MNGTSPLSTYARAARRSWWILVLSVVSAGAVAFAMGGGREYEATTTLLLGESFEETNPEAIPLLAQTYADLAVRQPVLEPVAKEFEVDGGWQDLRGKVEAAPVIDTPLLELSVRAESPARAKAIADGLARQLVEVQASAALRSAEDAKTDRFVREQLTGLQAKIDDAEQRLADLHSSLSAGVPPHRERQILAEIESLELAITSWQEAFANLAAFLRDVDEPPRISILAPAQPSSSPVGPSRLLNGAIGAFIGLLLGLGLVVLRARARDAVTTESEVTGELGLKLLGAVRRIRGRTPQQRLLTRDRWSLPAAEDYRVIRHNIEFASDSRPARSILVTNPPGGEGKTTTVANLGLVMAGAGLKTIFVDADLRRPRLHQLFGVPREPGLGDFLRSPDLKPEDIEIAGPIPNALTVPCGAPLENPSDWLGSPRMAQLLSTLKRSADVVILDSPPTSGLVDAMVLAKQVDGVLLVIDHDRTGREAARQAVAALQFAHARVLGAVLNRAPNPQTYGASFGSTSRTVDRHSLDGGAT